MAGDRYVALALAHVRSRWFTEVARWSTTGALPLDFVKCLSAEEVRAHLSSGRSFSALVIDAKLGQVDRDLVDLATARGAAVLVVDDGPHRREWSGIGARQVLASDFTRNDLLEALQQHATMIATASSLPGADSAEPVVIGWRGRLLAVTGRGGVGTSTVAMALAQGLGDDARYAGLIALADCSLDADLALLHDARDIVPGLQELVELHRAGRPTADEIRALTFEVTNRHYQLLLGLRRHRDWAALRPRAFEAAIDGLRRTFRVVVADTDPDLEGEDECGSYDVEERNVMARSLVRRADVVVAVGAAGVKALHSLVRTVHDLRGHGVEAERILAVVNHAPRGPRARAELSGALADLTATGAGKEPAPGPIFLPQRRGIDDLHRDGARLPPSISGPLVGAVHAVLDRAGQRPPRSADAAKPVSPGSLGTWTDEEAANQ